MGLIGRPVSGRRVINAAAAVMVVAGTLAVTTAAFGDRAGRPAHPDPPHVVMERFPVLHMGYAVPEWIRIPSIHVNARLVKIGMDSWGALRPPPLNRPALAGWYAMGRSPGEIGSAVVAGHVDSRTGPAVFYRLKFLHPGARILVDRRDGSTAVFRVQTVIRVPKTAFPAKKVYGDVPYAGLRIITCGGVFDRATGHYRDNVIVFARLQRALDD
jgi:hypothetical protein